MRLLTRRLCFIAALALALASQSWAVCPPRVLTRLGKEPAVYRDRIISYWKTVPARSDVERGMLVTLSQGGNRGAEFASGIIEVFVRTSGEQFERVARLKDVGNLDKQIAALGSREWNRVTGVSAELRFADERIGAANVRSFQDPPIIGSVPDILDNAGNLYEIKYRSWTDDVDPEDMATDLREILRQADIQQRYAASQGKTFTLAFEVPVPPAHQALFDTLFDELMGRGNVVVWNGF